MRGGRRTIGSLLAAAAAALVAAAPAAAVPDCTGGLLEKRVLISGKGLMESVIVDDRGRLFYSDGGLKAILRVDRPGAEPRVLTDGIEAPGGMAFDGAGKLLVGYGDSVQNGSTGLLMPRAGIYRVDPDTGARTTYATNTQMSNGMVRAVDGTVFVSSDLSPRGIDRVSPTGGVQIGWAAVNSANGLAIDRSGRYLFAAQTFQPAAIARVEISNPATIETFAAAGPGDMQGGPDGMDIDAQDRLYVAVNLAGELWRVGTDRSICALGRGLGMASAVALGRGAQGFAAGNLYVVNFGGVLTELRGAGPGAAAPPAAPAALDRVVPRIRSLYWQRVPRRITFTLSEPAEIVMTIQRRVGRRLVTLRTVRFWARRAGLQRVVPRLRGRALTRDRYRITVRAADRAGNRSGLRAIRFGVL